MTRAEMMRRMSSRELSARWALERIEPLPNSWAQSAMLATLMYGAWFDGPRKRPSDFIPACPDPRPQSAEEGMAAMAAYAAAFEAIRNRDQEEV